MRIAILYVAFTLLLLQNPLSQVKVPGAGMLDEGITVFIFLSGVFSQAYFRRSISRAVLLTILIYIYILSVSLINGENRNISEIFIQCFITTKFFFLAAGLIGLNNCQLKPIFGFPGLLAWLGIVTLLGIMAQAILGTGLFKILHVTVQWSDQLSGFTRMGGFQLNANAAGVVLAFAVVYLLHHRTLEQKKSLNSLIFIGLLLLGIVATGSRTSLIIVIMGWMFTMHARNILPRTMIVVLAAVLVFVLGGDLLDALYQKTMDNMAAVESGGNLNYPRWLMAYYGVKLAFSHFPIGAGAGTFGSVMSGGSAIYSQTGLLAFQSIASGGGIYDSNFGSIAGEYGFVGIIIFYYAFISLISYNIKISKFLPHNRISNLRWMFILIGIVETFMRPLLSSSYYGGLLMLTLFACLNVHNTSPRRCDRIIRS